MSSTQPVRNNAIASARTRVRFGLVAACHTTAARPGTLGYSLKVVDASALAPVIALGMNALAARHDGRGGDAAPVSDGLVVSWAAAAW